MELDTLLRDIEPAAAAWRRRAEERTQTLLMPPRALGRLHEIAERLCAIQQTESPSVERRACLVLAGDHGVAAEGTSAYPQAVTGEMVRTFLRGGASINVLAREAGADVLVVDLGIVPTLDKATLPGGERLLVRKIAHGTFNIARGPAMSRAQAEQAILTGFEVAESLFERGVQLLGVGDMGIANTTASAAVAAAVTGISPEVLVGRGTGVDDAGLERKRAVVREALRVNAPNSRDGLDVLAKVGGFEIGGIAGALLAGAHRKRAVLVDGFIATAGALVAAVLCPACLDYAFFAHASAEPGAKLMLGYLQAEPLLDLGLRLGEGTGAALAMGLLSAACRVHREVMTFAEAGVSGKA